MRRKHATAVLAAALLLAGCGDLKDRLGPGRDPLAALGNFALDDLRAALADAQAHDDQVAAPCWAALIALVERQSGGALKADVAGGFSAFQRARDLIAATHQGPSDLLTRACGPVVLDTQATLLRLGVIAGGGLPLP